LEVKCDSVAGAHAPPAGTRGIRTPTVVCLVDQVNVPLPPMLIASGANEIFAASIRIEPW
jgi:hypothetical protein